MKAILTFVALSSLAVAMNGPRHKESTGGYLQEVSGNASFTYYNGCTPSAGKLRHGFMVVSRIRVECNVS
jgi:hypothetical protein